MKNNNINFDKYGAVTQRYPNGDTSGSDSTCWTGNYIYLTDYDFNYVEFFEHSWGGYVRHPDPELSHLAHAAYYKNPWDANISRDQLTGIVAALIKKRERMALLRVILHSAAWGFMFSYNNRNNFEDPKLSKWKWPDPTLFNMWAIYLRGFGIMSWLLFPIIMLFDLHLLIDTFATNKDDSDDILSYIQRLFISRDYVPTPISWLAVKFLDENKTRAKLESYWCGDRDNCGIGKLMITKMEMLK